MKGTTRKFSEFAATKLCTAGSLREESVYGISKFFEINSGTFPSQLVLHGRPCG